MSKITHLKDAKTKQVDVELTLGKRHQCKDNNQRSFKSKAISLGFSSKELSALSKIYMGPAQPDTNDG